MKKATQMRGLFLCWRAVFVAEGYRAFKFQVPPRSSIAMTFLCPIARAQCIGG